MRRPRTLTLLMVAAALCGCASLSEKECRSGDWFKVGKDDGEQGLPSSQLDRHREACGKHGIQIDPKAYGAGLAEGLKTYCTPAGGYLAGRRGEGYRNVCPGNADAFLAAFRRGQEVDSLMRDVRALKQRSDELQVAAMSNEYSDADRTQLRFRADEAQSRLRSREFELERLDEKYAAQFGAPKLTWAERRDLSR